MSTASTTANRAIFPCPSLTTHHHHLPPSTLLMPTDEGSTLQLRLSLSSNTSFKRSFQELFGGAESDGEQGDDSGLIGVSQGTTPVGHAGRVNGREGRNKRQRSESQGDNSSSGASTSTSADSSSGSLASSLVLSPRTSTSGATDNRISGRTPTRSSLPNGTQEASLPPRLPTPRLDDVQMSDIPLLDEVRDGESLTHATLQAEAAVAPASGSGSEGSTSSHSQRSRVLQEPPQHLQHYQQEYQQQYQPRTQHSSSSSSLSPSPSSPSPLLGPSTILTPSGHPTGSTITNLNLDLTQLSNEHAATSMGSLRLGLFSSSPGPVPPSSLSVSRNPSRTAPPESEERFRATMERYSAFENAMAALRRSVSPPPPRGPVTGAVPATSPPRLPPLELSSLRDVEGGDRDELQESIRLPEAIAATPTITNIDDTPSSPIRRTRMNGFTHSDLGLPSIGGDSGHTADHDDEDDELDEFDEGSDDEDGGDEVLLHNHQHQHTRPARIDGTPLRDAPPRIELSNSLWSSLGMGGSRRNSTAVVNEERIASEMERQEEEQDDLVYPDPSFRDRLDSALEALRSPSSPLVPGLEAVDSNQDENLTGSHPESSGASLPSSNSNATPQTQISLATPLSNTAAGPSRSSVPPTLPPILTDSANSEWRRDLPAPHDRHLRRVSREEYDRRTLQRLGEVQVPSPSLSGFYDWLEGASANVPTSGTRPGPTSGLNMVTNAEAQEPAQDQGGEARSWEEEVLSDFVNTRLGFNLGLPRRDREEHIPPPAVVPSPGPDTGQSAVDGVVMDVDMEPDAEREREVERLPWTLGSSISSPNQPTSRLNLNRESRRPTQSMPEQYRRLNLLHDEWDPVRPQGHGQTQAGPSTSAYVPLTSGNDTSLPSFSSSLFSSPSPPPPPPQPTASTYLTLPSSTSPSRQNLPSAASRVRLPSSILSPRRSSALSSSLTGHDFVPRAPDVGSTARPSSRTSLPPSLSLDLGLNNSIFGLNNTDVSDHTHITPNDNSGAEAPVSSEHTRRDSLTNIFEPPPPRTHWRLHEALSAADSGGLRAPTRVLGSSNSLVAENAAEMRRRYARADFLRRLGASQRFSRSSVSNLGSGPGSSLSSSTSGGSGTNLDLQSGAGDGTQLNLWERQSEASSERITSTRESQVEERGEQRTQPQTQSRFDLLSHSQSHRGNFFGTFGGLGLPPRNSGSPMNGGLHASRSSESGSSIASSTGVSLYSGVVPPPPRPRLHSVRRVLSPTMPETAGFDSSFSDGQRRSTPWSLEAANTPNVDEGLNANTTSGSRPMTSGEAFIAMLGLQLPPNHEHRRRRRRPSLLYADSESDRDSSSVDRQQLQRNARTSVDSLGSSDSSMSSESLVGSGYGSGVSSASVYGATTTTTAPTLPGRAMFLDTELPSPGLGELFDTLVSPSANNNPSVGNNSHLNRNSFDLSLPGATGFSSAPLSTPASATTFNSSGSSGYFSPLGRFTPSPVRTSDEDAEVEPSANDVRRLNTRFRRMESGNEMLGWLGQGWDEESTSETGEMDDDGNQRDRHVNQTTNDQNQSEVGRRPQEPRPAPSTLPLQNDFTLSGSRERDVVPERRHIIDPMLFGPGPFRSTMETLAMTARDYAARASSSSAASRAATTMSSPVMSLPSPSSSSVLSQTFAPRSHHSVVHSSSPMSTHRAAAQSPPVIPPLSFENVPGSDNTGLGAREERHTAGNAAQQLANEGHPALRQGGLGDYLRWHEEQRRRETGNVGAGGIGVSPRPTLFGSSSSASSISSSSDGGMHLSWSHLERSPERSESGASVTHAPVTSNSGAASAPSGQGGSGGEIEGLQHAIGVMRGDGLSLERSLQFWRGFYTDQMRGRTLDVRDETHVPPGSSATSQAQVQSRNPERHNRDRGSRSPHVPRWRYGHQMTTTTSTTMTTTSTSTTISNNNVTGPSPLLNVDRTRSRLSYPSWHDVVLNRPSSMEDVLEGIDSDSADDEDFEALLSLSRPPAAAPVGPRAPRLESFNRLSNRYRLGGVSANPIPTNPGSGSGSGGARSGSGLGGNGGRGEPDLPHFPRMPRERMIPRYRPPPTLGTGGTGGGGTGNGLGTSGGRRFGGFARRFGNLGDYVNDEDFDASYESLLSLQAALGDVRPRSTPEAVLKRLKSAKYREWADKESDARCPICLEEYAQDDMVMKSGNCKHWLHKACLEQWLKTANTCPVCRTDVEPRPTHHHPRCPRHRMFPSRREGPNGPGGDRNGNTPGPGSNSSGGSSSSNADPNSGPSSSGHSSRFGGGPF